MLRKLLIDMVCKQDSFLRELAKRGEEYNYFILCLVSGQALDWTGQLDKKTLSLRDNNSTQRSTNGFAKK